MTLPEALHAVTAQGRIPASRLKDMKTSIRYFTQALGTTPDALTDMQHLETRYRDILTRYFTTREHPPGRSTVKNTLTNLSFLFRTAREAGLLQTATPRPSRRLVEQAIREKQQTSPYRQRANGHGLPHYTVPRDQWPADIREAWQRYKTARQFEVRQTTLTTHESYLMSYVGYCLTIEQPPITTWAELFNPERVMRFIPWHAARLGANRITQTGVVVARMLITLARHDQRPEYQPLRALAQKLKTPEPMHNKQDAMHTIHPKELEEVGLTLLTEARTLGMRPYSHHPGLFGAAKHQTGLILRLLVRVPLRSRNVREMQLGRHLFQDSDGVWQLRYQGDDLKIRQRKGRINTFARPFPTDLVEHLEEFLREYRPRIPNSHSSQYVFLTIVGRPFSGTSLQSKLAAQVWLRLNKRFYPHLIRTIMTDTMLLKGMDVSTVAYLLNDTPEMIYRRYHELRANDHIKKVDQFMTSLLGASATMNP